MFKFTDRPELSLWSKVSSPHPFIRFEHERNAYAHLLHYGACAKGAVPQCHGWIDLTQDDVDSMKLVSTISEKHLAALNASAGRNPPKALVLEYFSCAKQISIDNVTPELANRALHALYWVHASYVWHRDFSRKNILVLPSERVAVVDFDAVDWHGKTTGRVPQRQVLFLEMMGAWAPFYSDMVRSMSFISALLSH